MSRVYVAPDVTPVIKWHKDRDCHGLDGGEPRQKSELPRDATACSYCAGGVSAQELRKKYSGEA